MAQHVVSRLTLGGDLVSIPPCYSSDSKYLIVACNQCVNIYSTRTGLIITKLIGHTMKISAVFLNPFNSLQVYTCSMDGTIRIWDIEEGQELIKANICPNITLGTPSYTEEGIIYITTHSIKKSIFIEFFEVYIGISPRNSQTKSNGLKNLGKETLESHQSIIELSDEEALQGLLGTGLIGPDGKEILAPGKIDPESLPKHIEDYKMKITYFPAVIQGKKVRVFVEKNFLLSETIASTVLPFHRLFVHKGLLFFITNDKIRTIPIKDEKKSFQLTCFSKICSASFHPTKDILAFACDGGAIHLWRFGSDETPKETLHWHNRYVKGLTFSQDGTYLLSGAAESVLVIWQLQTGRKQFLPGMGSAIASITISPDSKVYAVGLTANGIHFVNSVSSKIHKTITSLVHVPKPIKKKQMRDSQPKTRPAVPFTVDPRSGLMVSEGVPGTLQFYNPSTDIHVSSLVVVRNVFNDLSCTIAAITHIAFSKKGDWLVTVDTRSLGKDKKGSKTIESALKFWKYSPVSQSYKLTTQVVPPHDELTSLSVCPANNTVITTGSEGKFVMWEQITIRENATKNNRKKEDQTWRCQSVGYYRKEAASASSFSHDGSLLAISYGTIITLWDPKTLVLKTTLNFAVSDSPVRFINYLSNSPFLLTASSTHLCVWNLLTLEIIWYTELTVIYSIAADPHLPRFAVLTKEIFDAPSIYDTICHGEHFEFPKKFSKQLSIPVACVVPSFSGESKIRNLYAPTFDMIATQKNLEAVEAENGEPSAKKRPVTLPIKRQRNTITGGYVMYFSAENYSPSQIIPIREIPRSGIVYLNQNFSDKNMNKFPLVSFISNTTAHVFGDLDSIAAMKEKISLGHAKSKGVKQKSVFSEIYGELKDVAAFNSPVAHTAASESSTTVLSLLDSPSHLIPSVSMLYSTFMDHLVAPQHKPKQNDLEDLSADMDVDTSLSQEAPGSEVAINKELLPDFDLTKHSAYSTLLAAQFSSIDLNK